MPLPDVFPLPSADVPPAAADIIPVNIFYEHSYIKFIFYKKATKIDEIFTVDLTVSSKCQIDGEDFVSLCGLLRKHEL